MNNDRLLILSTSVLKVRNIISTFLNLDTFANFSFLINSEAAIYNFNFFKIKFMACIQGSTSLGSIWSKNYTAPILHISNFYEIDSKLRPKLSPKEIFDVQFFQIYLRSLSGGVSCPCLLLKDSIQVLKIFMTPFVMVPDRLHQIQF